MPRVRVGTSRDSARQRIECRAATLRDYEGIQFLQQRYAGIKSYDEWSHKWVNNPVCRRAPDLPMGWVLEDNQHRIVGSLGSIPFGFELDGRSLIACMPSGWVVEEQHRAYGLLLVERFLSQPGPDLLLCASTNASAEQAVAAYCAPVPAGRWDHAAFWVTKHWDFVNSALANRRLPFRGLLRYPVWTAMVVRHALRPDGLKAAGRRLKGYEVRVCTEFDERFDDFWLATKARNPHRLLATRSREVLEWHFKHPFARKAAWLSTVCDGGRLVAYAVFCRKELPDVGLRRVRLMDYQSIDGDTSLLVPLLVEELQRCRREGTSVLESIGWQLEPGGFMAGVAPYSRQLESWQYYYRAEDPVLASVLKDPAVWSPSQYDGDACL
jgi:hypothetical protein